MEDKLMKKGTARSEDTKRKLRLANKGQVPWNKGKTGVYSEDTKKKMREAALGDKNHSYGKKHTETHTVNQSKAR